MPMRMIETLLAVCGASLLTGTAFGQDRSVLDLLQHAGRVDCRFTQVSRGNWTANGPEIASEATDFSASFFDIDVEGGTAEAEGKFGDTFIVVRYAQGYLHFMQTQNSGPVYITTVLAQPAGNGRFKAVHTRHEYTQISLPGYTSRPEMYLGDCAVERETDDD